MSATASTSSTCNQTLQRVNTAYAFVRDLVAGGGTIMFVGTKKQTQDPVAEFAVACGMPYVNQRWLGGMLTNFQTVARPGAQAAGAGVLGPPGDFDAMPKKEALQHQRELEKLERNLGGIRRLQRPPDAIFVIDTKKEHIAVTEANKLHMPVVAVVDTNCDPDVIDYVIPGNDDAIRAGRLMCRVIADAVAEGRFIALASGARRVRGAAVGDSVPAGPMPAQRLRRQPLRRHLRRQPLRRRLHVRAFRRRPRRPRPPAPVEAAIPAEAGPAEAAQLRLASGGRPGSSNRIAGVPSHSCRAGGERGGRERCHRSC